MFICPINVAHNLPTISELSAHLNLYHEDKPRVYLCRQPGCVGGNHQFATLGSYMRHLKTKINVQIPELGNVVDAEAQFVNFAVEDQALGLHVDVNDIGIQNNDIGIDNEDIVDENNNVNEQLSLEFYVHQFFEHIRLFVASLYSIPDASRKQVQSVLESTTSLLAQTILLLKRNVFDLLSKCNGGDDFPDLCTKVEQMFEVMENPFEAFKTENQRFTALDETGYFIKPESFLMGHVDAYNPTNVAVRLERVPVFGQVIPLRKTLKCFLELPGMFEIITEFVEKVHGDTSGMISHFMQAELWQELSSNDNGELFFPIHIHFDDYEPDNSLGSHHGDHSLAGLYACLGCLPPEIQSEIKNLFLVSVFESKYRKMFGNRVSFDEVVTELTYLEQEGISICVKNRDHHVRFRLVLIRADNLGCHVINGFVGSFRANFYCKFCKMHRNTMDHFCDVVPDHLMRSVENYNADIVVNDVSLTGLHEVSVWNDVPSYHCITNVNEDVMHTLFEGVLKYDLCHILYYLIGVKDYFSIEILCDRIDSFDYGPNERGNKPPTCNLTLDKLANCTWNLYSCEYLCLCRYLGEIIGDLVPQDSPAWKLYQLTHEITLILTSPSFEPGTDRYVELLVIEHHKLYVQLFGNLKPKHHFLLHAGRMMRRNGPLIALSALLTERGHTIGKKYANACNSRINFPLSVATKYQLILCDNLLKADSVSVRSVQMIFASRERLCSLEHFNHFYHFINDDPYHEISLAKSVIVAGTRYSVAMIVVLGIDGLLPKFGQLKYIFVNDVQSVYFVVRVQKCLGYNAHTCSYSIEDRPEYECIAQTDLAVYTPLWVRTHGSVSLRHAL